MSSKRGVLRGDQTPRVAIAPKSKWNEADDCAFLAARYGLEPDNWQYTVLDHWLRVKKDGLWASDTCGLAVPRQNGKNGVLEMVELYFMVALGLKILHTAHEVKTARKAFLRIKSFFENPREYPELAEMVKDISLSKTLESVVLHHPECDDMGNKKCGCNGGSVEFVSRSRGSARGYTVDVVVFDEAQELGEESQEALTSTNSAAPSGNPLEIYTGTPPGPTMNGEVFTRVRNGALSGEAKNIAWLEWSVEGDVDLDDRAHWAASNPALGIRITQRTIIKERRNLSDAGFARERLGMWASEKTLAVIPGDKWNALEVDEAPSTEVTAFGLDMWHDRTVSIGACTKTGDDYYVVLAALDQVNDTLAVVEWLTKRCGRRIPVVIDSLSPAASMIAALRQNKVKVITTTATDMQKACGGFYDDAMQGRLTHFGQTQLDQALAGASKRAIGNAGGWGWNRKDEDNDISPLVAVTLARFGASVTKKSTGNKNSRVVVRR